MLLLLLMWGRSRAKAHGGAVIFNGTFGWDKGHEAALWVSGTDRPVEQQVPRPWGMRCAGMVGPPRTGRDVRSGDSGGDAVPVGLEGTLAFTLVT